MEGSTQDRFPGFPSAPARSSLDWAPSAVPWAAVSTLTAIVSSTVPTQGWQFPVPTRSPGRAVSDSPDPHLPKCTPFSGPTSPDQGCCGGPTFPGAQGPRWKIHLQLPGDGFCPRQLGSWPSVRKHTRKTRRNKTKQNKTNYINIFLGLTVWEPLTRTPPGAPTASQPHPELQDTRPERCLSVQLWAVLQLRVAGEEGCRGWMGAGAQRAPTGASVKQGELVALPFLTTRCHHSSRNIRFSLISELLGPLQKRG